MKAKNEVRVMHWSLKSFLVIVLMAVSLESAFAEFPVQFGGPGDQDIVDTIVDSQGNTVVVGHFVNSITFDDLEFKGPPTSNVFVAKYRASGDLAWAKVTNGNTDAHIVQVYVDNDDNIYLNGFTKSPVPPVSFPDTYLMTLSSSTLTYTPPRPTGEIYPPAALSFIAKLDAGGSWIRIKSRGGYKGYFPYPYQGPMAVVNHSPNSLFPATPVKDSVIFTTVTSTDHPRGSGLYGAFAKLDTDMNSLWPESSTDPFYLSTVLFRSFTDGVMVGMASESDSEFYVLANLGSATFPYIHNLCNSDPAEANNTSDYIIKYREKYNSTEVLTGLECVWIQRVNTRQVSSVDNNGKVGADIVAKNGKVYYRAPNKIVRLDGSQGAAEVVVFTGEADDINQPVAEFAGHFSRALYEGGRKYRDIEVDETGNIYISGAHNAELTFGSLTLSKPARESVFVAKLSPTFEWLWATNTSDPDNTITSAGLNGRIALSASDAVVHLAGAADGILSFDGELLEVRALTSPTVAFDGIDDYLTLPAVTLPLRDKTIEFHFKIEKAEMGPWTFFSASSAQQANVYSLVLSTPTNLEVWMNGVIDFQYTFPKPFNDGQWHTMGVTTGYLEQIIDVPDAPTGPYPTTRIKNWPDETQARCGYEDVAPGDYVGADDRIRDLLDSFPEYQNRKVVDVEYIETFTCHKTTETATAAYPDGESPPINSKICQIREVLNTNVKFKGEDISLEPIESDGNVIEDNFECETVADKLIFGAYQTNATDPGGAIVRGVKPQFAGDMDDLRMWGSGYKISLSSDQSTPLTGGEPGLLANWRFDVDMSTANSVPDTTGNYPLDLTALDPMSRPTSQVRPLPDSDLARDGYISLLDSIGGNWLITQNWEIGDALVPPDGALALQPDIKIDGQLATDSSQYLYWSAAEGKLYAIGEAPGIVTIEWKTSTDLMEEDRIRTIGTPVQTSKLVQKHIAGTSIALEPLYSSNDTTMSLRFSGVVYPSNSNNLVTEGGAGKIFNRPSVRDGQSRYVVLQYTVTPDGEQPNLQSHASVFQVVYTEDWQENVEVKACTIGQALTDERHAIESGRSGHVVNSLARFDESLYADGNGPIFPVNKQRATNNLEDYLAVVWYSENTMGQYWADTPVKYNCEWPTNPDTIVISNQQGFKLKTNMSNPAIYRQANFEAAGFNPNEEHALLQDNAVFALRNDLNSVFLAGPNNFRASEPYVLLKYQDTLNANQWAYKVLAIEASTIERPFGPVVLNELYKFNAGQVVQLPQPLTRLGVCEQNKITNNPNAAAWEDYKGVIYARAAGNLTLQYYYPLQENFDYDLNNDGVADADAGTCVPWLDRLDNTIGTPVNVNYRFDWPAEVAVMKPGETLFDSKLVPCWIETGQTIDDIASKKCDLPKINGLAAAQIIYDQSIEEGNGQPADAILKLIDPLSARSVGLEQLPGDLATFSLQGKTFFSDLPFVLRSRLSYNEIDKTLNFKGTFDDSQIGDPHLLPNIMTAREKAVIADLHTYTAFQKAIKELYDLSRNPYKLDLDKNNTPDTAYLIGLQPKYLGQGIDEDGDGIADDFADDDENGKDDRLDDPNYLLPAGQFLASAVDKQQAESQALLGTSMMLSAGRPANEGFVTVAFNNDLSLSSLPVTLKVIKLDASVGVYQGNVWIVPSDNVFEEALTLRHSGDFAGDPDSIVFQWYYQEDSAGQPAAPVVTQDNPNADTGSEWIRHLDSGAGALDVTISGPGLLTLSDNWFITRYGGNGLNSGLPIGNNDTVPSPWAGDPSQPADAPKAMLATGWIKRVISGLNPYDQRVNDFHNAEVNTLTSMIAQAGAPYTGPIPFNPDPNVINGVGIIEAYQTILERGQDLSIRSGYDDIAANSQLLNAATRIADLNMLLGNEAYADAQDSTIGFDTSSQLGTLASSIFTFQNQLNSPLEEELVLLRGRDDSRAGVAGHPVNNRLLWNFTQGSGEVAYAQSYRISDQNSDGFINETDARILYPQGHGDAYGYYLSSVKSRYQLLQEPNYTWIPRAESVLVNGLPNEVDYMDERKFAAAAAAKARAGAEIVNLTYREKYVEAPAGQWQGYKDTDTARSWGLDGWGRRGGQGAYFDWVTANAILPSEDPNPDHTGIEKIDRTTVTELAQIIAGYNAIQAQVDKADAGLNPLGLAKGVVPFDIDPNFNEVSSANQGQTHFDQIAQRAQIALDNAVRVFDHASQQTQSLRKVQDDVDQLSSLVKEQESGFKNKLIEIFGYPYAGDIGGGKTYPSDYDGPDLYHYMYVTSDLTGDSPVQEGSLKSYYSPMSFGSKNSFTFDADTLTAAYNDVNAGTVLEVENKIAIGGNWQFIAPDNWINRRAPGEIQVAISDLLQSQVQLQSAIKQHENLLKDVEAAADLVRAEYKTTSETISVLQTKKNSADSLKDSITEARRAQLYGRSMAKIGEEVGESMKECFPKSVGFSVDATSVPRCTILAAVGVAANVTGFAVADEGELVELGLELTKESAGLQSDIDLIAKTTNVELLQRIKELEQLWRQEAVLRLELFTQSEVVNQSQGNYYAKLAEGQRLLEERRSFRSTASAETQQSRYSDMTFRIFRNDALSKYRASFDLAARYVYLAAAAYDYETNLLGSDAGSGREFLADIVRERSLGQVIDGVPVAGTPGLADVLARLTQNFDVYRGQLGFNNPQIETNRFSLRNELFRKRQDSTDANSELVRLETAAEWRGVLEDSRVPNLWEIPEFKRYARPFTTESQGPQPGLVIRFPTSVNFGMNFFGHELGGGDSAYDPTNFATKIRGVGTWFTGYDGAALSNTPRVYLVPVGMDVLRSPSGDSLATREWRVIDQKLPAPFPIGNSDLSNPDWIPMNDSLSGTYGDIRRHSSYRAYHDKGKFDQTEIVSDSRLIGRSVWNTDWMLIIPGGTLLFDSDEGLDRFIHGQILPNQGGVVNPLRDGIGITDIQLNFQTYGYSGN